MEISLDYRFFRCWQEKGENSKEDSESISDGVFLLVVVLSCIDKVCLSGEKKPNGTARQSFPLCQSPFRRLSDKLCYFRRLLPRSPRREQSGRTLVRRQGDTRLS